MGKHAYLVVAHNDWGLLSKLLRCIDDPRNGIFIHVDKKANFVLSEVYEPQKTGCSYVRRRKVSWGGYSIIAAELALLEAAVIHEFDYYHLLSGQDLPIKSQDYIHAFFDNQSRENSYIEFASKEEYSDEFIMRLIGQYHFLQDRIGRNSGKWIDVLRRLEKGSLSVQRKLKVDRIANYPFKIYKTSFFFYFS